MKFTIKQIDRCAAELCLIEISHQILALDGTGHILEYI